MGPGSLFCLPGYRQDDTLRPRSSLPKSRAALAKQIHGYFCYHECLTDPEIPHGTVGARPHGQKRITKQLLYQGKNLTKCRL